MTSPQLPRRPLGKTGLSVTPIGIGGAYLGLHRNNGQHRIDKDLGVTAVLRALELGINLIDTSAGYMGDSCSEQIVGKAIAQWMTVGGRREDIVLETKTGTRERRNRTAVSYSGKATWESIETSLHLLNVDYLDIALVHDPIDLEPVLAPDGAWAALQEMKSQGMVRAIGLGTRSHESHQRIIATGACDVCLTHSDFNLLTQTAREGILKPAAKHNVAVLNGTSLANGLLLGAQSPNEVAEGWGDSWRAGVKHRPGWPSTFARAQALWDWTQSLGLSLLALNLQYIAREPSLAATLMGASTPAHIEADVAAITAEIPETVWDELAERMDWAQRDSRQGNS
jgi:aryl-alcohol dehydrogenase-like predicted oxidoreductase